MDSGGKRSSPLIPLMKKYKDIVECKKVMHLHGNRKKYLRLVRIYLFTLMIEKHTDIDRNVLRNTLCACV